MHIFRHRRPGLGVLGGIGVAGIPDTYNLTNGLATWRTLRSNNTAVSLVSNSIGAGYNLATPATERWFNKLMAQLKVTYGDGGEFLGCWNDQVSVNEKNRWTLGANWSDGTPGYHYGLENGTASSAHTAVCTMTGTYFDFYSWAGSLGSAGIFNVSFDGGANDAVGSDGASPWRFVKSTLTKSAGSHTLSMTKGTLTARFAGVSARSGTGLFGINNSLNGASLGAVPSFGGLSYLKQLELIQPALLIISHGINERKASTAPATFQANLDAWVAAAIQFTSVLIVTQNPDGQEYANPASLYNQACYDVAKKYGTAFINMHSLFGGTYAKAVTNGYMGVEQTHPNATGHTFYYNTIYNALTVT